MKFEGLKVKVTDVPGIPGGDHYPEFSEPASQVHVLSFFWGEVSLNKFPVFEFFCSDSRAHLSTSARIRPVPTDP